MAARSFLTISCLAIMAATAVAADLAKTPRTITKEPAYTTKTPEYLLLAFGPEAGERVWLVRDGGTLYVDRNGNGDLTEAGDAVTAKKREGGNPDVDGYTFEVGDITVGGRTHKAVTVGTMPLATTASTIAGLPDAKAVLRKNAKAQVVSVMMEVQHRQLKGPGVDGRVPVMAGPLDLDGVLVFGTKPQDAPILHVDGPLQVTCYFSRPTLQIGRETDVVLVVGAPGLGKGSFTMLQYDQVIPASVHPKLEITFSGSEPHKELYELKERC
jgi:hypothetical protein